MICCSADFISRSATSYNAEIFYLKSHEAFNGAWNIQVTSFVDCSRIPLRFKTADHSYWNNGSWREISIRWQDFGCFWEKDAYLMVGECTAENISSQEDNYAQKMDYGG